MLKTREKVEIGLVPVAIAIVGFFASALPARLSLGALITIGCLGWLVQGGLRDLWLLYLTKARADSAPRRTVACMCLESSAGMTGIILGIALSLLALGPVVTLTPLRWMLFTATVLVVGFLAKDYIIAWRPLSLRREPDHHTFIFSWK